MSSLRRLRRQQNLENYVAPARLFHRMIDENIDVLQNVEFALLNGYRHNRKVDDRAVAEALRTAIAGGETADETARQLVESLAAVRHLRGDISDQLWTDALKVVLESVGNHSTLHPGDRGYLEFVSAFVR